MPSTCRLARRAATLAACAAMVAACDDPALVTPDECVLTSAGSGALSVTAGDSARVGSVVAVCTARLAPAIRWSSAAPDVAIVDSVSGVVRGLRAGSTSLTATLVGMPSVALRVPVTVLPPRCANAGVVSISITPQMLTVVPGGTGVLAARVFFGCDSVSSAVHWVSADTSVATVDSLGRVLGRTPARATTVTAIARSNATARATANVVVVAPGPIVSGLSVTPPTLALGPLDTARIRATVTLGFGVPPGTSTGVTFRSADPCAARVDSTGLVTALAYASPTTITVAASAAPTVAQQVRVTFPTPPPTPALYFAAPAALDSVLRGTVTVVVGLDRYALLGPGRAELWLGGRLAASAPIAPAAGGTPRVTIPLTVNTAARDTAGSSLFPNGARQLEVRVHSDGVPLVAGCPTPQAGLWGALSRAVTVANP